MLKVAAAFVIAAGLLVTGVSTASAISIQSAVGETQCVAPPCVNVTAIPTVNGVWQPNFGSSVWVSFANTGVGGASPANSTGVADITGRFRDTFVLPAGTWNLTLHVWADDTAGVLLNGSPLTNHVVGSSAPNLTPGGACAPAPGLGCLTTTGGLFTATLAGGVSNTLEFDVYQTGLDTFGLLYAGDIVAAVPEPASILLLGSALTALGVASRRRWQKRTQLSSRKLSQTGRKATRRVTGGWLFYLS